MDADGKPPPFISSFPSCTRQAVSGSCGTRRRREEQRLMWEGRCPTWMIFIDFHYSHMAPNDTLSDS